MFNSNQRASEESEEKQLVTQVSMFYILISINRVNNHGACLRAGSRVIVFAPSSGRHTTTSLASDHDGNLFSCKTHFA